MNPLPINIGERFEMTTIPDRLAVAFSVFAPIDAQPFPGMISPPASRGGATDPSYIGEPITICSTQDHQSRTIELIFRSISTKDRRGHVIQFEAIMWCSVDKYRDLLSLGAIDPWCKFTGQLDFVDLNRCWIERTE